MIPVCLGLGWLAGLIWYASAIPVPAPEDAARRADAIVVLTGGSERVREGLDLLEQNLGDRLFISGVPAPVTPADLWHALGVAPSPEVADRVILGHAAADTLGNAVETMAWARANGLHSLRLVTAAYHMRRALLEFHSQMPDITVIPHPVYPAHVKQDSWWRFPGTAGLLAREYTKYLVALLRLELGLSLRGPAPVPPRPELP
ncbi:YdcF family protein [Roseospira marina]|uniref:YdcF family protein n=2 Tax=Roseospira marina TaxID=140057 RepID=A0A5M6I8F6_9PROT|nr:YdcF family protein [Roseospira marina]